MRANMGVFLFSALVHAYVGMRLIPALLQWPWAVAALASLLLSSTFLLPLGLYARRARTARAHALAWAGLLLMGLFSSLFVLTLMRDLVLALAHVGQVAGLSPMPPVRTTQLGIVSAAAVPLIAFAITAIGLLNARRTAQVVTIDVPISNLPEALRGFSIAQISDVHVGPTIKRPYVEAIVASVNRLHADVVAVTGDLVDGSVAELAQHVAPLAQLQSREGTFFVTGNHEYYSGASAWIAELRRLGLHVLQNEHVVFRRGEATLVLAGVTDPSAHHFDPAQRSDPAAALDGAPAHPAVKVLLAHQPRSAGAAARAGFDLQLSGHTHGGQFFPWNLLIRWFEPFAAGLNRLQGLWVYTSRGTGYWGPPKRLGAPSEISLLRLVPLA
jgi:uncharacterized protein